ncbi:short-chain dehydrogenase/reductase [Lactobacillus backii] [Lactiplantibacillus mudanjiangensis]|uniref:SDR family oxidoreductase n=1 Tax=Lactiplantibacillus mudanjiangensis TaxID=1296538 RepID=UPI001014374E|nr:short-chain dehydrogenase/reductase [Lactobacillus backii] [Lactiplantibacillus mudanjiangensis]
MTQSVAIITGASSGMGKAAAELFAQKGWQVFGGARHVDAIPQQTNIHGYRLDVTDEDSVTTFMTAVMQETKRVDVLINVVGYGEYGPVEEVDVAAVETEFQTNYFGAVRMVQAVLPTMRQQGAGRIVNVSSGVGNVYMPTGSYYSASKAALQIWSDTLNLEVQPFGIQATVVMPGATKTNFLPKMAASFKRHTNPGSAYQPLMAGVQKMTAGYQANATAADLAVLFYRAATDNKPKLRYFNAISDRISVYVARNHPNLWHRLMTRNTARMMNAK